MYLGSLEEAGEFANRTIFGFPMESWRLMFVIGILPAALIVFIQFGLKEPETWRHAVAAGGTKRAGSYGDLLGDPVWRKRAVFGLLLALSGVIGLWGIGFFSYDLQSYVATPVYQQEAVENAPDDRRPVESRRNTAGSGEVHQGAVVVLVGHYVADAERRGVPGHLRVQLGDVPRRADGRRSRCSSSSPAAPRRRCSCS